MPDARHQQRSPRIFLLDPACVQTVGHNLGALRAFSRRLRQRGTVRALGCRYLPADVAKEYGIRPYFNWYYPNIFSRTAFPLEADRTEANGGEDPFEVLATRDAVRFLDEFQVGASDVVVFPHADIYGVFGLLNALSLRPVGQWPHVRLRMINVMEHAAPSMAAPRDAMLNRIGLAIARGMPIGVSAETSGYASDLAARWDRSVPIAPYPAEAALTPLPRTGLFVAGHLGTARSDKGFFDLLRVAGAVAKAPEGRNIRFLVQAPDASRALENVDYMAQFHALPRVEFVEGDVAEADWVESFKICHCLLLPYDRQTYSGRGSAIAMEAARLGRPIVTLSGVGFATETAYYGLGAVVRTIEEIAPAIMAMSREPIAEIERRMRHGYTRLMDDAARAYEAWLFGETKQPAMT